MARMWKSTSMVHDLGFDDDGQPVLITRAAYSYDEQHRQREGAIGLGDSPERFADTAEAGHAAEMSRQ